MGKIVKKYRIISPYKLGVFESWLSDMAEQGLQLSKINYLTCSFEKSDPLSVEYRVVMGTRYLKKEQKEIYQQSGWSYVCSYREAHIFCAPTTESLLEIYTDPKEQSDTVTSITKKLRFSVICLLVADLFMLADNIVLLKIGNTPFLNLINFGWQTCISTGFLAIVSIMGLKEYHGCNKIRKHLAAGKSLNHHSNWRKGLWIYNTFNGLTVVFVILSLIQIGYQANNLIGYFSGRNAYNLTMDTQLPIVRLDEIEECENAVLEEDIFRDGYNGANRVQEQNDLMVKHYYEVTETYNVEGETWDNGNDVYKPSLQTEYYVINTPFLVDGALEDLVYKAEHSYFDGTKKYQVNYKGLDEVYYIENTPNRYFIVARKHNKLIKLQYQGKQDYKKVLGAIAENLS